MIVRWYAGTLAVAGCAGYAGYAGKKRMFHILNVNKPMDISCEQENQFRKATPCSIFKKNFNPEDE